MGGAGMNDSFNWKYTEDALQQRIDIHNKYATFEINDWILKRVQLGRGEKVLDLCCGNGKQSLLFAQVAGPEGSVTGLDISDDLLGEARRKADAEGISVQFIHHDMNQPLPFEDDTCDLVTCSFALYYAENAEEVILDMKRVLRPGGRIFIAGPTVNNSREMLSMFEKITGKTLPQLREKRMRDEIIPCIRKHFTDVKVDIFKNPVVFPDSSAFLSYFDVTLLLKETSEGGISRRTYLEMAQNETDRIITGKGSFTMTKEVYGITGYK